MDKDWTIQNWRINNNLYLPYIPPRYEFLTENFANFLNNKL